MLPGIVGIGGFVAEAGVVGEARTITQTDSRTTAAASHATVSFGDVTATSWVGILAFHGNTGTNPGQTPSCTIGGGAATRIVAHSTGDGTSIATGSALFVAQPGVTSGTVAVTWGVLNTTIVVFRTTGYDLSAAFDTAKDTANMSLDIPALGLTIAATQNASGTGNVTWTGLTERGDEAANSKIRSWAWDLHMALQSGLSVSPSPYSATQGRSADIVASFSAV
ncbi:MAG: hypothetical protein EOR57_31605 [Mesorhizobium sp.]|uniref:hypothetical protein n=1 Tax=Mesorhizobium sp. TaxID=1871066 RepID=UPI000FE6A8A4|nr:hypothetical protein [Mesorhizobium sp.]RWL14894.1 MAG: hypothetical protein EOR57_31605 [Mesorhizobium sp.]